MLGQLSNHDRFDGVRACFGHVPDPAGSEERGSVPGSTPAVQPQSEISGQFGGDRFPCVFRGLRSSENCAKSALMAPVGQRSTAVTRAKTSSGSPNPSTSTTRPGVWA